MDPATILALISLGLRLTNQVIEGVPRAKQRLANFEAYLLALRAEGREPTDAELAGFVADTFAADDELTAAIERLKAAAGG